jgi:hypothetical protein
VCLDCCRSEYGQLILAAEQELIVCPGCGIDTSDGWDAVYLSFFIPGVPEQKSEMPMCGPCAVALRNKAMTGALLLENRSIEAGGLGPQPIPSVDVWDQLGLRPERRAG